MRATLVAENQRALNRGEFLVATARNIVMGLEVLDNDEVPDVAAEVIVKAVPQVGVAVENIQEPLPIEVPRKRKLLLIVFNNQFSLHRFLRISKTINNPTATPGLAHWFCPVWNLHV